MDFFSDTNTLITVVTLLVAGGIAVVGLWDKKTKQVRVNLDLEEDRLISLLQTTVKELEKKVEKSQTDIKKLQNKVSELEHENKVLINVLQGRDKESITFQKEAREAMVLTKETHSAVLHMVTSIDKLVETLNKTN